MKMSRFDPEKLADTDVPQGQDLEFTGDEYRELYEAAKQMAEAIETSNQMVKDAVKNGEATFMVSETEYEAQKLINNALANFRGEGES